jgi:hypothetical protein
MRNRYNHQHVFLELLANYCKITHRLLWDNRRRRHHARRRSAGLLQRIAEVHHRSLLSGCLLLRYCLLLRRRPLPLR